MLQDWPAQSPDRGRRKEEAWTTKPKIVDDLWEAWKTFFALLDDFINKLSESLLNHMNTVLQGPGRFK